MFNVKDAWEETGANGFKDGVAGVFVITEGDVFKHFNDGVICHDNLV